MAKFRFIYWLLEYLLSQEMFVFDWDDGNTTKSEEKHGIEISIIESCFYDQDLMALGEQYQPIVNESRYGIIAKADTNEVCFICFTIRDYKIRPISARKANQKERGFYEQKD